MIEFFIVLFCLLPIIGFWVIFEKAGRHGWAAIIPIYNIITLLAVGGKPWWWIFILWFPLFPILLYIAIAKNFGKGGGFAVGLIFLPFIFFLILAFSDAKYQPIQA